MKELEKNKNNFDGINCDMSSSFLKIADNKIPNIKILDSLNPKANESNENENENENENCQNQISLKSEKYKQQNLEENCQDNNKGIFSSNDSNQVNNINNINCLPNSSINKSINFNDYCRLNASNYYFSEEENLNIYSSNNDILKNNKNVYSKVNLNQSNMDFIKNRMNRKELYESLQIEEDKKGKLLFSAFKNLQIKTHNNLNNLNEKGIKSLNEKNIKTSNDNNKYGIDDNEGKIKLNKNFFIFACNTELECNKWVCLIDFLIENIKNN